MRHLKGGKGLLLQGAVRDQYQPLGLAQSVLDGCGQQGGSELSLKLFRECVGLGDACIPCGESFLCGRFTSRQQRLAVTGNELREVFLRGQGSLVTCEAFY